jgi:hypothetical protein
MPFEILADNSNMNWMLALFLSQQPASQADQLRAAMAASIEKQLASVQIQVQSVGAGSDKPIPITVGTPESKTPEDKTKLAIMLVHLANRVQ